MSLTRRVALALLAAGFIATALPPAPAHAEEVMDAALDDGQWQALKVVETYLNGVKSLRSRFIQIAPDGSLAEGSFYLRRPGRLRFEYDPPVPILIVGDGFLLHYQDKELGQVNEWPIFDTPIGSLSRDDVGFGKDLAVTEVVRREGRVSVTVVRRADPGEGSLTLDFTSNPTQLAQWRVTDAQGYITTVALKDLEVNVDVSAKLFVWEPPKDPNRR
ncbi:MAG: outer membrane lipoprotein carrier protein LolA [Alphaproteobacteria bacterium]|nr:outer membrane lipoprotein carrier protein LolA [Alphaproteobacteria bacterium]